MLVLAWCMVCGIVKASPTTFNSDCGRRTTTTPSSSPNSINSTPGATLLSLTALLQRRPQASCGGEDEGLVGGGRDPGLHAKESRPTSGITIPQVGARDP